MKQAQPPRVRLGVFELDLQAGELRRNGEKSLLQEQPFQILRMLVEREGELLSREEIQKKLWPNDTIVEFDHSINAAIKKLRRAFDDSAAEPKYIETVARRGYRLMVPVERLGEEDVSGETLPGMGGTAVRLQPDPGLIGKKVSHYRVLEVIGGGGMGLVYKAEDLKLGRRVALKFLPEDLTTDEAALQRFEREARTASSLNHPNICTIFEVEEHEAKPFLVMELLEGETLRDRLSALAGLKKKLPTDELLDIAIQICSGLEAAHAKGIIHRDIKPANIFLTNSGQVKILDFGLAKAVVADASPEPSLIPSDAGVAATEESRNPYSGEAVPRLAAQPQARSLGMTPEKPVSPEATLTRFGVALGTAGYMSPEQVRGEKLDARTDIFSLGLVLYEMACGQRAYAGDTAAIVKNAIITRPPTPLHELNSAIPSKLVAVIEGALEKDRERRCQFVSEMRANLDGLKESTRLAQVIPQRMVSRRWVWLATAVLLLALATVSWFTGKWRHRLKLTEKDTIVFGGFINNTGDPIFDGRTLTTVFDVALSQTPFIHFLENGKFFAVVKQPAAITNKTNFAELARPVCVQTNSRAFVVGSITNAGNGYQIELRAVDCRAVNNEVSVKIEAEDRDQVVKMLGIATVQLRRELGEPQAYLEKFNQPLEMATTSSLEALHAFSLGRVESAAAPAYFERAIALDPNFVLAYFNRAHAASDTQVRLQNLTKAYQLRTRAIERDRLEIEAQYYWEVTKESEKSEEVDRQRIQAYPHEADIHDDVSGDLLRSGDLEKAAAEMQEALRLTPDMHKEMAPDLMVADIAVGQLEDAKSIFNRELAAGEPGGASRLMRYYVAFLERDRAGMKEQLDWAIGKPWDEPDFVGAASDTEGYCGRLSVARQFSLKASLGASHNQSSNSNTYIANTPDVWLAVAALREAEVGDMGYARQLATETQKLKLGLDGEVLLALTLVRTGDVAQAQLLASKLSAEFPHNTMVQRYWLPTLRGGIKLHEGSPSEAIQELRPLLPYDRGQPPGAPPKMYPVYLRGLAYLQARQGEQAAVEFRKIVDQPHVALNFVTAALARVQLARAQAMMGDNTTARKSYQDFLTLWKDADPDIPILKEAKAEYAKLQ